MSTEVAMFGPVDYSTSIVPNAYHCRTCKRHGCKLWREYNTFAHVTTLACIVCLGMPPVADQIGMCIAAVPTAEGDTFWSYCAIPDNGCKWWYRLPNTTNNRFDPRSPDPVQFAAEVARELRRCGLRAKPAHRPQFVMIGETHNQYDPQLLDGGPTTVAKAIRVAEGTRIAKLFGDI